MAHPRDVRIAELKAQIESAKAEIKQLEADVQAEVAEDSQLDGNLMNRNTDAAIAAYEADKKNERELTGERNEQGDFINKKDKESDSPLEVPITLDKDNWIDKDERTDEESARRKFTGVEPVEYGDIPGTEDTEMGGGRAKGEEVEASEKTDGFKADDGGNMSVDEKDDFWKTQEGYDKAMEMYGQKPSFVPAEPTMVWNPEEQKYEKIKDEDKEEFEDLSTPSISADIKKLFG